MGIWAWLMIGLGLLVLLLFWLPLEAELRVRAAWPRRLELEGRLRLFGRWTLGRFDFPGRLRPGGEGPARPMGPPPGWRLVRARVAVRLGLGDPAVAAIASGFLQALGGALRSLLPVPPELSIRPVWSGSGASLDAFLAWHLRGWNLVVMAVRALPSHRPSRAGHPKAKPG